jgi:hypothetical protein
LKELEKHPAFADIEIVKQEDPALISSAKPTKKKHPLGLAAASRYRVASKHERKRP